MWLSSLSVTAPSASVCSTKYRVEKGVSLLNGPSFCCPSSPSGFSGGVSPFSAEGMDGGAPGIISGIVPWLSAIRASVRVRSWSLVI